MSAKRGNFRYAGCSIVAAVLLTLSCAAAHAQAQDGAPVFAPDNPAATPAPASDASGASAISAVTTADTVSDPSLTTHETAVECAVALIVEKAGERSHMQLQDPQGNSFKAGLCSGKIQTYMLTARAENPTCFPKLELEDGMRMFVKWVEAHPEEGKTPYIDGMKKTFEDTVPCLKK